MGDAAERWHIAWYSTSPDIGIDYEYTQSAQQQEQVEAAPSLVVSIESLFLV
ncbi:MAG: hypothetical protein AAF571_12180 [Verrucomicrobiota bacterium]